MGIYARSDNSRGVHKAPANEVVRACVGLEVQFDKGGQDILNPKGVNLILLFPGQGMRVQRIIEVFLREVWRSGGLAGSSPEEAFYVNIGRDTMTQEEIDNGHLICIIRVVPVKPAEFIIFRITQNTASAQ